MDFVNNVKIEWVASNFKPPNVLFLICSNRVYAIAEDDGSIITAVSKTNVVYAISRSKVQVANIYDVNFYYVEDPRNMRVISCTESTNKNLTQIFVIKKIVRYIENVKFN